MIDSESYLGLTEISAESSTNDLIETSDEIMPHMHVYDAFHAESELIPVARLNGITNAIVAPQNQDTLPGQDVFVQLDGKSASDMLLVRDIAMPLNFTGEQRRNESWEKTKVSRRLAWVWQRNSGRLSGCAGLLQTRWADYEKKKADTSAKPDDKKKPTLAPEARSETGSAAALFAGQEADRAGSPGTQRSGDSRRTGPGVQFEVRA